MLGICALRGQKTRWGKWEQWCVQRRIHASFDQTSFKLGLIMFNQESSQNQKAPHKVDQSFKQPRTIEGFSKRCKSWRWRRLIWLAEVVVRWERDIDRGLWFRRGGGWDSDAWNRAKGLKDRSSWKWEIGCLMLFPLLSESHFTVWGSNLLMPQVPVSYSTHVYIGVEFYSHVLDIFFVALLNLWDQLLSLNCTPSFWIFQHLTL